MTQNTDTPPAALVLREDQAGVTTLTLNRPAQYNTLSHALLTELLGALKAVAADPTSRVVILAGAGKAFCSGHDLKEMRANPSENFQLSLFQLCSEVMTSLTTLPQPVIARVHGIATAAGCQLVSMCDLAVAADDARFAVSGINVGLFCSTPGVGLSRNVGRKQAMEMLLTGDFISATEARDQGLVNQVVPLAELDTAIAALSAKILAKSPRALAMGKRAFYEQIDQDLQTAYQTAAVAMATNMMTHDAQEGIDAFIEKRPPVWTGK